MAKLNNNFAFVTQLYAPSIDPDAGTGTVEFDVQLVCVTGPNPGIMNVHVTSDMFTLSLAAMATAVRNAIDERFAVEFPGQTINSGAHVIPSFQTI